MPSNPIRDHIRTGKARRKALNADWWSINNHVQRLEAESRRLRAAAARLPEIQTELETLTATQAKLAAEIRAEDEYLAQLKTKLGEKQQPTV
jgi:predicted RNase H-like nuclease (RuvC/YqgF family)